MDFVTLVNRTKSTLSAHWDGKDHEFTPGKHLDVPKHIAWKAKEQHPLMGTEDPFAGTITYKFGVKEWGDDCTALKVEDLAAAKGRLERINREVVPDGKERYFIPHKAWVQEARSSMPADGGFQKDS